MELFRHKGSFTVNSSEPTPGGHTRSWRVARWLLILPLLVLIAVFPSRGSTHTRAIHGPFTFVYHKSGGFIGVDQELIVDSANQQLRFRSRSGRVETRRARLAEIQAIRDALEDADFIHLRRSFKCGPCFDQFMFDGTLRTPRASNSVHWEDGSNAPPGLRRVDALLDRLIADRFSR